MQNKQELYNKWLYLYRTSQNKPFTARKNVSSLGREDATYITRIQNMLEKYPHITATQYFEAPFKLYPEKSSKFNLKFFSTMKGIRTLRLYFAHLQEQPPDNDFHIQHIATSLKFIAKFCSTHKISLNEYPTYKAESTYSWMRHLKERKISVFVLMEFPEVYDIIIKTSDDEKEFLLGNTGKYFLGYKTKYLNSTTARVLVRQGLKRIERYIEK